MTKLIVFLFIFIQSLNAISNPFEEYKTQILETYEGHVSVKDSDKIVIGSSGIIIHKFDNYSTIIARVLVVKKNGSEAKLRLENFDIVEQNAFPIPGILPQKGDEVRLNYLYNRSLIIAPNEEVFNEITAHFDEMSWIHPDLIASELIYNLKPNPNRDDISKICKKNTTGLIFIALDEMAYFADCQSLIVLKSFQSHKITSYNLPFYHRFDTIKAPFWKFGSRQIKNYHKHFFELLRF